MGHVYNPSTLDAETGEFELEASPGYIVSKTKEV
jgi:hypothetical protein